MLPYCKMKLAIIYQCLLVLEDNKRMVEYIESDEKFEKDKENRVLVALINEEVLRYQIKDHHSNL